MIFGTSPRDGMALTFNVGVIRQGKWIARQLL